MDEVLTALWINKLWQITVAPQLFLNMIKTVVDLRDLSRWSTNQDFQIYQDPTTHMSTVHHDYYNHGKVCPQ